MDAILPADISFEQASDSDFDELASLRTEAMRESLERIGRFNPVRSRDRFRIAFSPQHTRHIIFEDARVGFLAVVHDDDAVLLDHLYIRPAFQGRGLGASVLACVIAEADAARLPIRLGALRDSDSNRFYVRHGFEKVGEDEWDIYYLRPYAPNPDR